MFDIFITLSLHLAFSGFHEHTVRPQGNICPGWGRILRVTKLPVYTVIKWSFGKSAKGMDVERFGFGSRELLYLKNILRAQFSFSFCLKFTCLSNFEFILPCQVISLWIVKLARDGFTLHHPSNFLSDEDIGEY